MNRRDMAAGVLVAGAVAAWVVEMVSGSLGGPRPTALVVTVLGLAAALVAGRWWRPLGDPAVMRPLAGIGLLTVLASVITLVTGSAATLFALVLLTVFLWVLATVHHATIRRR